MKRAIAAAALICFFAAPASAPSAFAASATISAAEKASLQAAMYQYIDAQLIRGSFLHVDFKNGVVDKLSPAKAHPMMLRMGENFVLCTSFRRADGKNVNVDFYVAKREGGYSVFQAVVDDRAPLRALIKAGKVRPIR